MMSINPEFRRNLWLEITPTRLVAMPVVLALVLLIPALLEQPRMMAYAAWVLTAVLLVVWGSRAAADSVLTEIAQKTWDSQKTATLNPWQFAWGKLFGSTAFVWYGALWCGFAAVVLGSESLDDAQVILLKTVLLFGAGLLAQAIGLFMALATLRMGTAGNRLQLAFVQMPAVFGALPFITPLSSDLSDTVRWWYFSEIPQPVFMAALLVVLIGWCLLGIHRLLRAEFAWRDFPWAWLCFSLFIAVLVAGFVQEARPRPYQLRQFLDNITGKFMPILGILRDFRRDGLAAPAGLVMELRLIMASVILVMLTYLAAFAEPKTPMRLQRWMNAMKIRNLRNIWRFAPTWLPNLTVLSGLLVFLAIRLSGLQNTENVGVDSGLAPMFIGLLCFVLRDIALLYVLTLVMDQRRGHLSAIILLVVLYLVLPGIVWASNALFLMPAFVPSVTGNPVLVILAPLTQASAAIWLLVTRWQHLAAARGSVK